MEDSELMANTRDAIERIQNFDTSTLIRNDVLGSAMNFEAAVVPADRLKELYLRVSTTILSDLPDKQLTQLHTQATADYNHFSKILEFDPGQGMPQRDNLIANITDAYQSTFTSLFHFISYTASKSTDFKTLEREARSMIQQVHDQGDKLASDLDEKEKEAERILEEIRHTAAEQGVSQQAIYFKTAENEHSEEATIWLKRTVIVSIIMAVYSIGSLFIHKIPFLNPDSTYSSIQLAISKALVFAVISYMLYLSAKNFLAHKHNSIINRHRQNALLTYTAILNAAKDMERKEVILNYAAACIFSPQPTGYSSTGSSDSPSAKTVVEMIGKPFTPDD